MSTPSREKVVALERPIANIEAEQSLLGALMIDPHAWDRIADVVTVADLYRADHQLLFKAIAAVVERGQPPDPVTVADYLQQIGELEAAGGTAYLARLYEDTPSAASIRGYAVIVRDHAARRVFVQLGESIASYARTNDTASTARYASEAIGAQLGRAARLNVQPINTETVADWAGRAEPPPRDWILAGLLPAARVTSLLGNGGLGKTTIGLQIGVHVSTGRPLYGVACSGGPVLGLFCEDEQDELERRVRAACAAEGLDLSAVDRFALRSRDGMDNLLCVFKHEQLVPTRFYREIEATIEQQRPRLVILDTAADLFGGDFMSTPHVRQFLKVALGGWCVRHGCAVLLLAHPSASAMSTGDGGGFSVAWNNSVRSRLYLRRPKSDDTDETRDRRVLEVRKANYAADGTAIKLRYERGCFVPDDNPLDEAQPEGKSKAPTRLAFAALTFVRQKSVSGSVVAFGDVFDEVKRLGEIGAGDKPEAARKKLTRALKGLVIEGLVEASTVPRGYRVPVSRA